jgi:sigma-E factor negative regulatory protein RseC
MTRACTESGVVTRRLPGDQLRVRVSRAEACHACKSKDVCASIGAQTSDLYVTVPDTQGARPGDHLTLSIPESSLIKASLVLYLIPAIGLILGAVLGDILAARPAAIGITTDALAPLGAALGLALGVLLSALASRHMGRHANYKPSPVPCGAPPAGSVDTGTRR